MASTGDLREPMVELFVFETLQMIEQLEQLLLVGERGQGILDSIDEIFRIMHTIKGSAAMMLFDDIADLAHAVEDLFAYFRSNQVEIQDLNELVDLVFSAIDYIRNSAETIKQGQLPTGSPADLIRSVQTCLNEIKGVQSSSSDTSAKRPVEPGATKYYIHSERFLACPGDATNTFKAVVFFKPDCGMENLRAFSLINNLKEIISEVEYRPEDIIEDESCDLIREHGVSIVLRTHKAMDEVRSFLLQTPFVKELLLEEITYPQATKKPLPKEIILDDSEMKSPKQRLEHVENGQAHSAHSDIISVHVAKLDKLMDLVGELVITEAMVVQHPELKGLSLRGFQKTAHQLRKITDEIQDVVMSTRMVSVAGLFQKMQRLVRDMGKKLKKDVELVMVGEETEVDKKIIDHLSDPLMHLIRNAMDHGIETTDERKASGKRPTAQILLEAKHAGSEVWITIRDDGRGLNREKIATKAKQSGLTDKSIEQLTDREIYSFILLPGFSTKDQVTEFSGRGVGTDVVVKNVEQVGGSVAVDSKPGQGTTFIIKIPLTIAILDGMTVQVGRSRYTIPTTAIRESFRPKREQIIVDPEGREMILIRGECCPIVRLHRAFSHQTQVTELDQGIIVVVEGKAETVCLFADYLLGQQQVVVKSLPVYIKKVKGIAGCTLLGDGGISLILDTGLINDLG